MHGMHLLWLAFPMNPMIVQEAGGQGELNTEHMMRQRDQKQKDYRDEKRSWQKKLQTAFQHSTGWSDWMWKNKKKMCTPGHPAPPLALMQGRPIPPPPLQQKVKVEQPPVSLP